MFHLALSDLAFKFWVLTTFALKYGYVLVQNLVLKLTDKIS